MGYTSITLAIKDNKLVYWRSFNGSFSADYTHWFFRRYSDLCGDKYYNIDHILDDLLQIDYPKVEWFKGGYHKIAYSDIIIRDYETLMKIKDMNTDTNMDTVDNKHNDNNDSNCRDNSGDSDDPQDRLEERDLFLEIEDDLIGLYDIIISSKADKIAFCISC